MRVFHVSLLKCHLTRSLQNDCYCSCVTDCSFKDRWKILTSVNIEASEACFSVHELSTLKCSCEKNLSQAQVARSSITDVYFENWVFPVSRSKLPENSEQISYVKIGVLIVEYGKRGFLPMTLNTKRKLVKILIHLFVDFHARFSFGVGHEGSSPKRTRNTSRSTAISDSSAGSTPRRDQPKSGMYLPHQVLDDC